MPGARSSGAACLMGRLSWVVKIHESLRHPFLFFPDKGWFWKFGRFYRSGVGGSWDAFISWRNFHPLKVSFFFLTENSLIRRIKVGGEKRWGFFTLFLTLNRLISRRCSNNGWLSLKIYKFFFKKLARVVLDSYRGWENFHAEL